MFTDKDLLASLEDKLQLIRDHIRMVAEGYANGFFLWGEGGTAKTFTVVETLKNLNRPFRLTNSHITAKGLFELLRDFPDVVHVLEDVETLFNDKRSFGLLRSALWGQDGQDGRQERRVTWQVRGSRDEFLFTGGIIILSNCRLDDIPQLRALKTRITSVQYDPTNCEVAALMKAIASKGHRHGPHLLSPAECLEVAEHIIGRSQQMERNLDLRLFVLGCKFRLHWANEDSHTHWTDLLESHLKERVILPIQPAVGKERERAVARNIADLPLEQRVAVWKRETGKSQATLYRVLEEVRKEAS